MPGLSHAGPTAPVSPARAASSHVQKLGRRRSGSGSGAAVDLHVAGDLAAFFDHQFAVADLAGDFAGSEDHQLFTHGQVAIEFAADFRQVDFGRALEGALVGDLDHARIHGRFDTAFHHQGVAIGDLNAFELDVGTDDQFA